MDPSETLHIVNQIWSAPTHLRRSDLATPICAARRQRSLFTCKRGCGLRRCAQIWRRRAVTGWAHCSVSTEVPKYENKMTTPTMTRKMCMFFFTGLDRSHLTNLTCCYYCTERCHHDPVWPPLPQICGYLLLSQERVMPRTSNLADKFGA